MKDYMVLESNTIAQASNKLSSITDALITGQETINTSELLNWIAIATNCLSEADKDAYYMYFGGRMESIAESARFINEKIGNNKFLSDDELLKKLGNTMLVLDKTVQCYSANKDCYEAIDKVYKNQEASIQKDTAIRLYNAYKTDFGKGISILFDSLEEVVYNEVSEYVIPDPVSIAYNLARLAFSLIGLDEVYGSAAVLLYVCRLQDDGLAAYKSYMKNLDYKYDTNEGIRLSLIYYLRMSQTCYGTLEKAYSYSRMKTETKECKNKQAEIDKIVASLLAAGNACMHDSIDKVKENVNAAKKAIKTATTYDGQEFIGTLKDIQLQNEQYKTNSFVDVYSTNLGGASSNKKPSISKNGYTYSYGDANKGEFTDVSIICEGYENKWIHYWIIKKDNKTGKSKAIIKDADGGIAVTDRFIYYLSNVYSEEGYQGFYGVEYVRTDLQGKNREVLYFSDYTPFGTGVGLAPSFLVTNDFLFISKEDLIRVDLSTKAQKIIIKDIGKKTSSDWMDIDFIYDGHYYFNLYDNENDYGADSNNLPDRCDGFFCYTEDSGISYIIAEYHNYKKEKSTLKRAGLKNSTVKDYYIYNYSYATDAPFSYLGIKYEDKKTGKKYFYRFADEKLAEIK